MSPARIEAQFGINEKRCRSAVNELIEKGYVIQRENGTNWYTFFELPIRENDVPDNAAELPISADDMPIVDRQTYPNDTAPIPELGREIIQDNINNTITNTDYNTEDSTVYYLEEDECFSDNLGWDEILDEEKLPF